MLKNKFAVITGGSDGIGFEIADTFAKNGANICLVARNEAKLLRAKESLEKYGTKITTLVADLANTPALENVAQQVLQLNEQVDILVNNAGIARFVPYTKMSAELLDMHIDLNVKAPYMLTHFLLESLAKTKGNVINISSYMSDRMLFNKSTAYSLTKGAINSFTKSLAFEVGQLGIRVNAIAPGSVDTPLMRANMAALPDEQKQQIAQMVQLNYPLGRIGSVADIANMAAFLASDQAGWITGAVMAVDGGLTTC